MEGRLLVNIYNFHKQATLEAGTPLEVVEDHGTWLDVRICGMRMSIDRNLVELPRKKVPAWDEVLEEIENMEPERTDITWEQVCQMRAMWEAKTHTQAQLKDLFGCSYSHVSAIVNYKVRLTK